MADFVLGELPYRLRKILTDNVAVPDRSLWYNPKFSYRYFLSDTDCRTATLCTTGKTLKGLKCILQNDGSKFGNAKEKYDRKKLIVRIMLVQIFPRVPVLSAGAGFPGP